MRRAKRHLFGAALALLAIAAARPAPAFTPPDPADLVKPGLVAEDAAIAPATTLWVDLHLRIKPGWHTYWRNPGDAGVPTTIAWHLPPGFAAGPPQWPAPRRFVDSGIGTYGYEGEADLLVPIAVPKGLGVGTTVPIAADASWLVCSTICIPGNAKLSLSLPVAQQPVADPGARALFAGVRSAVPAPAPFETRFGTTDDGYRLLVPQTALAGLAHPRAQFFPVADKLIDQSAPVAAERRGGGLELRLKKAAAPAPPTLDGILVLAADGGVRRAYSLSANPGLPPERGLPWGRALLLAFLGGVILNAMPCVFPILSLKLLGLARHAHGERLTQLAGGLAYAGGVLASFLGLAGALLALRAGGEAIGWGFQLQSPVFVAVLAYLLFAMGLSLSGVVSFGDGLAALGGRPSARHGVAGAFLTGVLATVVATPCTAPLMGAATGFALIAPAPLAVLIFLAVGLGLAAPYLLATALPQWQRLLPRPGAWMELAKQLLAFPLYGTVAWLVWVLTQEVGPGESLAALIGLVLVGFAAWIYGRTRLAAPLARGFGIGLALTGAAAAIVLAVSLAGAGGAAASARPSEAGGLGWQPFSAERLAGLNHGGTPVFVDMTAAWCVTCLVNEHAVLDTAAVRDAFAARGVVALKGDWTRQNQAITDYLQQFGRSGVPLYVLYSRDGRPQVLPQILTQASVLAALGKI